MSCAAAGSLYASEARALTIRTAFDSSVTHQSNAATIEAAFNTVASEFSATFATPVTVNLTVSWGSVGLQPLAAGDIAGSVDNLSGPYGFSTLVNDFKANLAYNPGDATFATAVRDLPTADPTRLNSYEIPYAEAKALGLLPANRPATDGYIGFKSGVAFDFNPTDGVTAGDHDFQGFAAHEIEEVLGRITGLRSAGSASWATPFDLFRFAATGVRSFSSSAAAYFSVDGGRTGLGVFNTVGAGDRGDWSAAGAGSDAAAAFFNTGKVYSLSAHDLTALDALGWGLWSPGPLKLGASAGTTTSPVGFGLAAVPEPASWALMLSGVAAIGGSSRRRRSAARTPERRKAARSGGLSTRHGDER